MARAKPGTESTRTRGQRPTRRSLENPNVPLSLSDPDDDTFAIFGAERSAAGVRVGMTRALGYPAVWRAISLISGDVAKLSLLTYRLAGANRDIDRKHPAYRLLKYKAHPDLLAYHLKQVLTFHALVRGNGYAFIDRDPAGRPARLLILDPVRVEPGRVDGELFYAYHPANGSRAKEKYIPAADVLHIRGLGYDGLQGYPVLALMRDSLGAAIAARGPFGEIFQEWRPAGRHHQASGQAPGGSSGADA
jgi:phage portal protein BeeE